MRHLQQPFDFPGRHKNRGRFSLWLFVLLAVLLSGRPAEARRYSPAAGVEEPVQFTDPQLRACIELHLGTADPTPAEMLSLTHLYAAGKDIAELTGLEHATNLTYLDLGVAFRQGSGVPEVRANRITDISALSGLAALTWLNLGDNRITDISALSGLTNLETLTLYGNQVADITALADLVRLSYLDLGRNRITDASVLAGLVNLAWLDMSNNQLADISPLSGLIALETLLLDRTGLESIHALSALQNLRSLSLSGNRISEISGLSGLTSLETVILYGNRITAIPALSNLPNLKSMALGVNRIADISGLPGLPALEAVDLKHNQITAIPPLAELQNLKILDCENNLITDISGLYGLPALEAVTLKGNRITAVPVLTGLPSLRLLDLKANQISEVPDLSGLPNLEMLDLEYNLITAVPAMPGLPNLKFLSLGNNYIADISGLSELTALESLNLQDNEITDVSILLSLFSLSELDLRYNPLDENTYSEVLPVIKANNPRIDLGYDPSLWAFGPRPYNGAGDVAHGPVLLWTTGAYTAQHDVYFGESEQAVADANGNTDTTGIYRGRHDLGVTSFDPGALEPNKTYYWRIDEVNEAESWGLVPGTVWSFTIADFIVVDDFELYDDNADANQAIFQTWLDGYGYGSPISGPYFEGNGTGSSVGYWKAPFAEQTIVHGGRQSMPLDYNNVDLPWYSQAERIWPTPQDWTVDDADTLQMFFKGSATNGLGELYISIEDSAGQAVLVSNPDPNAVRAVEWREWSIPLAELSIEGVDVTTVRKMSIGIGDPANPQPDGSGRIFIDDIRAIKTESATSIEVSIANIGPG
ncbi:MAG: hypothetical protein CEE38_11085 [Planctomycetes bacterium B3_Pla]|nr:MAG: hypothetical protein CEE38_11085 [Planctomycetes bacterium B3_Pla]